LPAKSKEKCLVTLNGLFLAPYFPIFALSSGEYSLCVRKVSGSSCTKEPYAVKEEYAVYAQTTPTTSQNLLTTHLFAS